MIGVLGSVLARPAASSTGLLTVNAFNLRYGTVTFSESNLRVTFGTAGQTAICIVPKLVGSGTGKWAMEFECVVAGAYSVVGICDADDLAASGLNLTTDANSYCYATDGQSYHGGTATAGHQTFTTGDRLAVLLDGPSSAVDYAYNGAIQGIGYSGLSGPYFAAASGTVGTTASFRISATPTYTYSDYAQWR